MQVFKTSYIQAVYSYVVWGGGGMEEGEASSILEGDFLSLIQGLTNS